MLAFPIRSLWAFNEFKWKKEADNWIIRENFIQQGLSDCWWLSLLCSPLSPQPGHWELWIYISLCNQANMRSVLLIALIGNMEPAPKKGELEREAAAQRLLQPPKELDRSREITCVGLGKCFWPFAFTGSHVTLNDCMGTCEKGILTGNSAWAIYTGP